MIYFYAKPLANYEHSDAKRFKLTGYPGGIYKAVDNADYGGGVEHCTEWVEKHGYTIKTKAEAQEIVDAGIISLNNFLADDELEGRPALVQEDITLE
jgi:hypothetical protein|tara:strand:- start:33 stop:323 length:291 start_codon:yes stop_codon:yes gene_type:complete